MKVDLIAIKKPRGNRENIFMKTVFFLLLAILSALPWWSICAADEDVSERIDRLRREIERTRSEIQKEEDTLKKIHDRKKRVFKEIELTDRKISTFSRDLRKLEREGSRLKGEIRFAREDLAEARKEMRILQEKFKEHLVRMYKMRHQSDLEILVSSVSFTEFFRRARMLTLIAVQDREYLGLIKKKNEILNQKTLNLDRHLGANQSIQKTTNNQKSTLEKSRRQKLTLRDRLASDEELRRAAREELDRFIVSREKLIEEVIRRSRDSLGFGGVDLVKLRGLLNPPVDGKIIIPFGKIRDGLTGTDTFNSGVDFVVAEGREVRCIADGVVLYTSFMRSYGNFIMVGHKPNYVSIYANLQEIQVFEDTRVVKDQVIGLSGQTGSLDGPKLHFELRRGMEPLDPRKWLKL